uniref:Guanosine-3',5'-bis(diphosphate) 3'-pyrophosphohydrolase MESH1 n=1 Tax=Syphacia muris TaxID=451379 RepID=A0A0N5AEG6_9BILA
MMEGNGGQGAASAPPAYDDLFPDQKSTNIYPDMPEEEKNEKCALDAGSSGELLKKVPPGVDGNDLALLLKAIDFAARRHRFQRRKDCEASPYVNHVIGVANILANEANITNITVLLAAVLHDTVEDTKTTLEEITELFGGQVSAIVSECLLEKMPTAERRQVEMARASTLSHNAKLVIMADKLYNLRDAERSLPFGWTTHYRKETFNWTKKYIALLKETNDYLEMALDDVINRNS